MEQAKEKSNKRVATTTAKTEEDSANHQRTEKKMKVYHHEVELAKANLVSMQEQFRQLTTSVTSVNISPSDRIAIAKDLESLSRSMQSMIDVLRIEWTTFHTDPIKIFTYLH